MNFGGTNGIKGNLTHMNEIPFQALAAETSIWGSGMTSEGSCSAITNMPTRLLFSW